MTNTSAIIQIPESFIIQSAFNQKETNNIFSQILSASDEYKKAGMTPIYLLNQSTMAIRLVTIEQLNSTIH